MDPDSIAYLAIIQFIFDIAVIVFMSATIKRCNQLQRKLDSILWRE